MRKSPRPAKWYPFQYTTFAKRKGEFFPFRPNTAENARLSVYFLLSFPFHPIWISPQAIFFPELPAGCVVKSSGPLWTTTVRPITSAGVNRLVKKER